jgi:transposase-like protein
MPHQLLNIVLDLNEIAKENQTGSIACHWCNNQDSIIKYGTYERYEISGEGRIRIQRFLCKRDQCRRTFCILPHPFLRFTSFTLCLLTTLLQLLDRQVSLAESILGSIRSALDPFRYGIGSRADRTPF